MKKTCGLFGLLIWLSPLLAQTTLAQSSDVGPPLPNSRTAGTTSQSGAGTAGDTNKSDSLVADNTSEAAPGTTGNTGQSGLDNSELHGKLPPAQPGFEQLRALTFPEVEVPKVKGAKPLFKAAIDLWAEHNLYFLDFADGKLNTTRRNAWQEKWTKRGQEEIADDNDYVTADLLARLAVSELGRFNYYLDKDEVAAEDKHADPTVVGVGARFEMQGIIDLLSKLPADADEVARQNALVIDDLHFIRLSPFKGSPAEAAGLKDGDVLVAVDGKPIAGKLFSDVLKLIQGKQGSRIVLSVGRKPAADVRERLRAAAVDAIFADPFTFSNPAVEAMDKPEIVKISIIREPFTFPVVHTTKLEDDIVVIKYDNFVAGNGLEELRAALLDVRKMRLDEKKPVKLIVDLRGNPGGLLDFAVQISSWLIPEGTIVTIKRREGDRLIVERWSATRDGLFFTYPAKIDPMNLVGYEGQKHDLILPEDVPLVILIDHGSYSASELVAGAVQVNGRGRIVGTASGGKGEGQHVMSLPEGRRAKPIKFFFLPGDREIDWAGIQPDEGCAVERERPVSPGADNQIDRAKVEVKLEAARMQKVHSTYGAMIEERTKLRKNDWVKQQAAQTEQWSQKLKKHQEDMDKTAAEREAKKKKPVKTGASS